MEKSQIATVSLEPTPPFESTPAALPWGCGRARRWGNDGDSHPKDGLSPSPPVEARAIGVAVKLLG